MLLRDLFDEFPVAKGEVVPIALQQLLATSLNVNVNVNVNEDWDRAEQLLLDTRELIPQRLEIFCGTVQDVRLFEPL